MEFIIFSVLTRSYDKAILSHGYTARTILLLCVHQETMGCSIRFVKSNTKLHTNLCIQEFQLANLRQDPYTPDSSNFEKYDFWRITRRTNQTYLVVAVLPLLTIGVSRHCVVIIALSRHQQA